MITFTLPAEFRSQAWHNQRVLYELITRNAWDTVNTFSRNDKKLRGSAGAVTVLHTHHRRLDYHPHVHRVMPAVAFDAKQRLWREKDGGYLFCHKALAKVFRAKMLDGIQKAGLTLPKSYPTDWVVDCKAVGAGQAALVYLGRYLYRGVLSEKNIVSNQNGWVTFRYQNSDIRKMENRTLGGVAFLKLLLQHILPKGFRRARNYGFLHPNSKRVKLVQWIKKCLFRPQNRAPRLPAPAAATRCSSGGRG